MPDEKKEEEKSAEDKIATSTGNVTEEYSKELEDESDQIIKDMYHNDDTKGKDDKDTGDDKDDKDEDAVDGDKDDHDDTEKDVEDDEVKGESDDNVEDLLEKLKKSEKRVKDTRADHTRGRQELKEAQAKTLELEDTIFSLRTKVEELTKTTQTKTEEKKTEKSITEDIGELSTQLEAMKKVDPDMAATMEPIVNGLVGQITTLKDEIATKEKKAIEDAEEAAEREHFGKLDKAHEGWEAMMRTSEFKEYLQELSPRAKRLALLDLKGGTAEDIIEVFDDFKKSQEDNDATDIINNKEDDKLDKAKKNTNPKFNKTKDINRGAKKTKYTRSEINNMSEKEYAEKEADIDKAMAEGLIENR